MKFEKDRTNGFPIHHLLFSVFILLLSAGSMLGAETAGLGDKKYDRLMTQHPATKLTGAVWHAVVSSEKGARKEITSKLHVTVVKGKITSVEVRETTGHNYVDTELVNWVLTQWHFRPNITDGFTLPIVIPLPPIMTVVTTMTRSADTIMLRVEVDHGVIKKMDLLHSSGSRLLDNSAGVWIKQHSPFAKDQSGVFELPIVINVHFGNPISTKNQQ